MSIIRLSLLEDGLYAPDARGVVSYTGPFSLARGGAAVAGLAAWATLPVRSCPDGEIRFSSISDGR